LERIVSLVGEAELSIEDQMVYRRARKLRNFMTQSFFVAEAQRSMGSGVFVGKDAVVADVAAILEGKLDQTPEETLLYIGRLSDLKAKNE